ncbi:MAG: Cardiolipin synthase [Thermoanaerobaculia bacterium]|nr:Cardiolipin synthase [Thermoanaerobaculia bacterium]
MPKRQSSFGSAAKGRLSDLPAIRFFLLTTLVLAGPGCDVANRQPRTPDTLVTQADLDDDIPRIEAKLDRLTGSKATLNRVTLLHLGCNSKPQRIRLIESAERTLFQAVPYWFDDEEGRFFRDLIRAKRERSPRLDLRILMDWTSPGTTGDLFGTKMVASLREITGGSLLLWNRPQWGRRFSPDILRNRMHEKLLVADGDKLIMGGMNVGEGNLQGGATRKGWHDTDILVEGPAAAEAQKVFLKLWELARYLESAAPFPAFREEETELLQSLFYKDDGRFSIRQMGDGRTMLKKIEGEIPFRHYLEDPAYFPPFPPRPDWKTPVRLIYDNTLVDRNPRTGKQFSKIMDTLTYSIRKAKRSIFLFIPYLTPHQDFLEELVAAARKDRFVVVITNSRRSIKIGEIPWKAGTSHYGKLLDGGVHLFEWQGHDDLFEIEKRAGCTIPDGNWPGRFIHSKVAVIDSDTCIVGSHNFNERSESLNNEVAALFTDHEIATQLINAFVEDLDLQEASRTVPCGDALFQRPQRVKRILPEDAERYMREHGGMARFLSRLQAYM